MAREARPTRAFSDALLKKIVGVPHPRPVFRFATVGALCLVLVFGMGTGVYAYESPDVVEGHPLYFMKQNMEKMEERMAPTSEARAEFHAKMYNRRMNEAERLVEQSDKISTVLESAAIELDQSVEELNTEVEVMPRRHKIIEKLSTENDRYERVHTRVQLSEDESRRPPTPEMMRKRLQPLREPNP